MILDETGFEHVGVYIEEASHNVIENKDDGHQCEIAITAYFKAERRGFALGYELDDWLEAEHDIMGSPE